MKAQIIRQFGDPNVFELADMPDPTLQPGHVIIKVHATSINPVDCKIRSGAVAIAPAFPAILHGDVSGVVTAVANDVTQFKVGDEVFGCAGGVRGTQGALADYMLADARLIAKKPSSLSLTEAAALPLISITASDALCKKIQLTEQMRVLIHGGVGGVGHIAVQLAKNAGADVYATVTKNDDIALAKSFGANTVINMNETDVDTYVKAYTQDQGFDVVFDTVGGPNLEHSLKAAAINGQVVTTSSRISLDLTPMHNKSLSLHVVFMLLPLLTGQGRSDHGRRLNEIANLVDAGKLKPRIHPEHFSLSQVRDAHAFFESGNACGKVLIIME